jgi:Zn-dependent protease
MPLAVADIDWSAILAVFLVVYSIILHEIAHGYAALRFGDETALRNDRLTLNPIQHIDPIGTIIFPLVQYLSTGHVYLGWAKPVPVNPYNLEPRTAGEIVVAVAGVTVNLLIAVLMAALLGFHRGNLAPVFANVLFANVALALFNLVPIPPLDGSHVVAKFLPRGLREQYEQIGFYGIFIILLLNAQGTLGRLLDPLMERVIDLLIRGISIPIRGLIAR